MNVVDEIQKLNREVEKLNRRLTGLVSPLIRITPIGGLAIRLYNRTGVVTVKGQLVECDSGTNDGFLINDADGNHPIGVVLESGIADDERAWIVISGIGDVALEDNTGTTAENWVRSSVTEAGYSDGTNAAPPGGGIPEIDNHFMEIGHSIETIAAEGEGTHILARCVLHFN